MLRLRVPYRQAQNVRTICLTAASQGARVGRASRRSRRWLPLGVAMWSASISRRYAIEDRKAWDPGREFVGQGLANLAAGAFNG